VYAARFDEVVAGIGARIVNQYRTGYSLFRGRRNSDRKARIKEGGKMKDIDVRRALLAEMHRLHPDKNDTLVVEELGLCQGIARVDVAVVNGTVHGYEIKSERDTLVRLKSQADVYSKALEFVTIVAAPSHITGIEELVPSWWGIWSATQIGEAVCLKEQRQAQRNPSLIANAIVQFLWREEALNILFDHNLATGVASKSRQHIWDRLSSHFSVEELADMVRSKLKQRPSSWRALASQG
jgi:hypothetical protein